MKRRHLLASSLGLLALPVGAARAALPDEPLVLSDIPKIGKPGGTLRMLVQRAKDTRLLFVYGHARLVNYMPNLDLFADITAKYDVADGRTFTFTLRRGHRWSDGHPFTSEDFRFYWEDVALNPKLRPTGPPIEMVVEGQLPKVEILDERTIRYGWARPNPNFLPLIAAASPEFIYMPAHYLKQFHVKYAEPAKLDAMVKATTSRDWAQLFGRRERMDKFDNPDLPTLQPWMLTTPPPADRYIAVRNPDFHRVRLQRAAATLFRPVHARGRRDQAHPHQDRRRPDGPSVSRHRLQGLHVPQGERETERPHDASLAGSAQRAPGALSQPQRRRSRVAKALPGQAVPPRAVARPRSGSHQSVPLLRPGDPGQQHDPRG